MKKLLAILLAFTFYTSTMVAGSDPVNLQILSGKIIDKQSGEALAGAKIRVCGTDKYCYTDTEGNFSLTVPATTNTNVTIDLVGYEPATFKATQLSLGSDIILTPH